MAVGHSPAASLSPQDEALFRAFQSNLLSLISHELRTPLMGVLNALMLLDSGSENGGMPGLSQKEMIGMARTNAQRLQRALTALLDLATLQSGTFHARLKELDLGRLAQNRANSRQLELASLGITVSVTAVNGNRSEVPVLGDAQKLARALDLCLDSVLARAEPGSKVELKIEPASLEFHFELKAGTEPGWDAAWSQGMAGFEGGVASPTSLFSGVMQSEQAFLTRMEEGLGSELLIVHEILKLHQAKLEARRQGTKVVLSWQLPGLSSEDGLRAVLMSRAYEVSTELASVALVLIRVPASMEVDDLCAKIKASLFRATDAAYALPKKSYREAMIALVLDDCKPEDAPRLIGRLEHALALELEFGIGHCPADGHDPSLLIDLARGRLNRR